MALIVIVIMVIVIIMIMTIIIIIIIICMYIYIYIYIYIHIICIYIYIYIERERDVYIYIYVYTCIRLLARRLLGAGQQAAAHRGARAQGQRLQVTLAKLGWINGVPAKCPLIARKPRTMFILIQFNTC